MYKTDSFYDEVNGRLDAIELNDPSALEGRITILEGDVSDLVSRCGTLESTVSTHGGKITALEAWQAAMPKRSDKYTGTTDANGDVTITFPTSRYTNVPQISMSYVFNNDNYSTSYNIKSLSASSVTIRVMRNKNSAVLLGGNIDPDEPLASTAITLVATEFA